MNKLNISDTMLKLRRDAGYTQAQVSKKLNIQRQTYCNYENASRTPPLEIIVALADLYQVTADYLIRGGERPARKPDQEPPTAISASDRQLLAALDSLPEYLRQEILTYIQFRKIYHSRT